jgi:putative membrane protein
VSEAELEGRLHPLAVLVFARRYASASLIPVVALLISLGTRVLVPLVLSVLLVVVPLAVLWWWRFTYRVTGGRLEVHSGLVNRTTKVVPLDRVRGVDLTAPFFHRLLDLVKVDIEAAAGGRDKAELSLAAVSHREGEALRERLLARARVAETIEPPALYHATPGLLAVGGLLSGRYLLAPAAVVGLLFRLAEDLPGGVVERGTEAVIDQAPTGAVGISATVVAAVVLVGALAAGGSLLVDWGFTLRSEGDRLTAQRGLLTHRTVSIDRARIRGLDVRDTPLRRPFRLAAVTAIAGGVRRAGGRTTLAPVVRSDDVLPLLRSVDPLAPDPGAPLVAHPRSARGRRFLRAVPVPAVATAVVIVLGWWWVAAVGLVLTAVMALVAIDRYRQLGHRFDGRRLSLRGGSLLRRWTELDPAEIVSFELRSSPAQRRAGLATVLVHLGEGAGSRRALDAGEEQARPLLAELHPRLFAPLLGFGRRSHAAPPPE